jgi:hypothetical protein
MVLEVVIYGILFFDCKRVGFTVEVLWGVRGKFDGVVE